MVHTYNSFRFILFVLVFFTTVELFGQSAANKSLSSDKRNAKFYFGISIEPGFSKFKPHDKLTFYQPNLTPHYGLGCQLLGLCGMHLAAFQPSIDIGFAIGFTCNEKFSISSGFFYAHVAGRLEADGILFAQDSNGIILQNTFIDSAYAFSHFLYHIDSIQYTGNYFMVPLLFHFSIPGEKIKANIIIGTRQYFLLSGSAHGNINEVALILNSYGFGINEFIGSKEINMTEEMQKFYIALEIGAELSWDINDRFLFLMHPYWVRGFSNLMHEESNIFIAQYGSTSNFETNRNIIPLNQELSLRKFGLGIGMKYEF